jgi:hypothetical protein
MSFDLSWAEATFASSISRAEFSSVALAQRRVVARRLGGAHAGMSAGSVGVVHLGQMPFGEQI